MTRSTADVDRDIQRVRADRTRVHDAIDAKLAELVKLRSTYAGTQDALDALLEERTAAVHAAQQADIERAADLICAGLVPPPAPTPHGGAYLPARQCTCRSGLPANLGQPCPQHGKQGPSHL